MLVLALVGGAALAGPASADLYDAGDWAPSIWSDKADYGPGEQVSLSGAQWQPGETVSIVVNDDAGSTWRRAVDVTAGESGTIEDRFDLPSWFVAEYSVTATGSSGAVATTSFTDANTVYATNRVPGIDRVPVTAGSSATFTVGARKEGSGPVEVTGLQATTSTESCGAGGSVLPSAWLKIDQPLPFSLGGSDANVRFRIAPPSGAAAGNYKALVKFAVNGNAQNPAQAGIGFALCVRVDAATQSQTITFQPPSDVTYGDAERELGATASSGLPVSYSSSTPAVCTVVSGKLHVGAAGACSVTSSQGGNAGWEAATPVTRTFTIAQAPLSVEADDDTRPYGDANPPLTGSVMGVKNGDAIGVSFSTPATPESAVGPYAIVPQVEGAQSVLANYAVKMIDGTLVITQAPLTATADDTSREYGEQNPAFTGALSGVRNGDDVTATYASAATVKSGVGEHAIVPDVRATEDVLANYAVELVPGTLVITKAPLAAQADDQSRIYGDENAAFTGKVTGVKNDDAIGFAGASAATKATGVGTYPIAASVVAEESVLANYQAPELTDGTLTITKAPLTAHVSDETVEYGGSATFRASYAGLKNGDTDSAVEGALRCAPAGTNAGGPYLVDCTGLTADNYAIAYEGGSLTVTKAELKVVAQDLTRVYGASTPAPQHRLAGFKNGETGDDAGVTGDAECRVEAGSDAGVYAGAVTCEPGSLQAANYRFSAGAKGTLTITKAGQTITFPSIGNKKLGDADFDAAATASSGLTVSYAAAPASVCTIIGGNVRVVGIGTCTVTAAQGGNGNYHAAADVARQFGVIYPFTGFFAPVDMGQGVLNKAKAGSTIPVKFRLGGDRGLGILAAGSPSSGAIVCDAGAVVDTIEELATTTTSGLKYDAIADQYVYTWKTDAKFASTCRQLVIKLADGQSYRANFTFTK